MDSDYDSWDDDDDDSPTEQLVRPVELMIVPKTRPLTKASTKAPVKKGRGIRKRLS